MEKDGRIYRRDASRVDIERVEYIKNPSFDKNIFFPFFLFFFSNETFSCGNSEIINVEISAFRDTVSREGWNFCEDFSYWGERGGGVCSYFD